MIARARQRLSDEAGFSLMEVSMTLILSAMITASMVAVFMAFSQNSGDAVSRADHQAAAREMIVDIVVEIRQAVAAHPNGQPIEEIRAGELEFYTVAFEAANPVRVRYERRDCTEGECELWVTRWDAVPGTGPEWEFYDEPREVNFLIGGVLSDEPIFFGVDWLGDPKARVTLAECGAGLPACRVPIVGITLRARPLRTSEGARAAIEINEEVRIRNA